MKIADIEKKANEIVEKERREEQELENREKAAEAKLNDLIAEAEHLASEKKFDEYADNMESQRKQKDIINLVKQIHRRTPEQVEEAEKTARDFYKLTQEAFDEDTKKDFKDLEEALKKVNVIAKRITEKFDAGNKAVKDVSEAVKSRIYYGGLNAPTLYIPETVHSLCADFERMHEAKNG